MLYQQNYRFKVVRLGDSKGSGSSKLQWNFEASRLEMKKRDFNWVLPTSIHTQRFAVIISFRRIFLTLRQLYPRAPSRPSVSPCRMHRSSTST